MAIGRISGALLFSDLDRQSTDLAFTTNGRPLVYMDFTNFRFGVNTNSLVDTFTVTGTANVSGVTKIFGNLVSASGVASTSKTTGALVVTGGAGITGSLYANALQAVSSVSTPGIMPEINSTNGTQTFNVITKAGAGAFNPSTRVNDTLIYFTQGSQGTGNLLIAPWATWDAGIKLLSSGNVLIPNTQAATSTTTGAFQVRGGVGIVGNLYTGGNAVVTGNITADNLIATNFIGNISSTTGSSSFSNLIVTNTGVITSFSTGNAVISGGYISALANITATTGNTSIWYATTLNSTTANISSGNTSVWYATTLNSTTANITNAVVETATITNSVVTTANIVNLNSGNAVISGGYISSLANATITTANIGNINFNDVAISSRTGNLILSPLLTNANAVVAIVGTTALQLPAGTTAQQPIPVYGGAIRWNNSTNTLEVYTGSGWISLLGQINSQTITPDQDNVNTIFSLDYSTTAEGIIVSINGTIQQPGVAYTVAGSLITFAEPPLSTDIISIRYIAAGTVTAENTQEINSANIALTTGAVLIDSFDKNTYRSARYIASTTAASSAEFAEFAVTQFDTTVAVSNVNRAITGSELANITANISGTTVRIYATSSTAAQMRLQKSYFVV